MTTIRHFINIVESSVLTEAQNYEAMFSVYLKTLTSVSDQRSVENGTKNIKEKVAAARRVLRKNDRIVWWARWMNLVLLYRLAVETEKDNRHIVASKIESDGTIADAKQKIKTTADALQAAVQDYEKKSKKELNPMVLQFQLKHMEGSSLFQDLEHLLSLPIPAIQNRVFQYETPEELIGDFLTVEEKWKKEADGAFVDERGEILIKFPDGTAWVDTKVPACSKEAKAMGHCGNVPSQEYDDTLLSLRSFIKRGDKVLHKPILTFVLDGDGYLGEMKGKANEKPAPKWHPHIIALLKLPRVAGIKGGGYEAHKNFSIYDLDYDDRDELLREKPELGGLIYAYDKYGWKNGITQRLLDIRRSELGIENWTGDRADGDLILAKWTSFYAFIKDVDDDDVKVLLDLIDPDEQDAFSIESINIDHLTNMVRAMDEDGQTALFRRLGLPVVRSNHPKHDAVVRAAAEKIERTPGVYHRVQRATAETLGYGDAFKQEILNKIKEYIETGWDFASGEQYLKFPFDVDDLDNVSVEDLFDGEVALLIPERDFIYTIGTDDDEDDYTDEAYALAKLRDPHEAQGSWTWVDRERLDDRRREDGIGQDERVKPDKPTEFDPGAVAKIFGDMLRRPVAPRSDDPRQGSLDV